MNNSNKRGNKPSGSLDGFMRPSKPGNLKPNNLRSFDQHYPSNPAQSHNTLRVGRVDNFKSADGFVPNVQPTIMRPGATNQPGDINRVQNAHAQEQHMNNEVKPPKQKHGGFMHFRRKHKAHEKPVKHSKLKFGLRTAGLLALVVLLAGGGLTLKAYFTGKGILKGGGTGAVALNKNVDPTLLKGEGDGRVNVLILGKGGPGHDGPDLTDTLLIASIDPVAKETALLSIPRDLWVKTSRGQSKINSVYANANYGVLNNYTLKNQTAEVKKQAEDAGIKAIKTVVSDTMGIPVQYYVMVDFVAFKQAINTVGGITIDVKTPLIDPSIAWENNNKALIAGVGVQEFDGQRALLYARSRKSAVGGTDFGRNLRQREVIVALKTKLLSLNTFANPIKVNQLINAFGDHISTDFSLNEMMRVYDIIKQVPSNKITSIGLADPPNDFVTTGTYNNLSIVQPKAGLFDYSEIQSFVRNTLRDPYLKSENATVIILNGTETPGLATLKSTELKSYGYNVTQVADAPTKEYTKTILVDLRKGVKRYTLNYLEKRLGVKATTKLPDSTIVPGTADFVIILGSSESGAN